MPGLPVERLDEERLDRQSVGGLVRQALNRLRLHFGQQFGIDIGQLALVSALQAGDEKIARAAAVATHESDELGARIDIHLPDGRVPNQLRIFVRGEIEVEQGMLTFHRGSEVQGPPVFGPIYFRRHTSSCC